MNLPNVMFRNALAIASPAPGYRLHQPIVGYDGAESESGPGDEILSREARTQRAKFHYWDRYMKNIRIPFAILVLLLVTGCAFTPQAIDLQPKVNVVESSIGQGRVVYVNVVDERTKTTLGTRGPGMGAISHRKNYRIDG